MSKYNSVGVNPAPVQKGRKTVNAAGGTSYERDLKHEIAATVLTCMLNGDSYYEKESDRITRLCALYASATDSPKNAEFLAKAMVYARTIGELRSLPALIGVVLAENAKTNGIGTLTRKAVKQMVSRVDDMTEMLALWDSRHVKSAGTQIKSQSLPMSLIKAFRDILEGGRFNEFQYCRYQGLGNKVKLRDLINVTHPRPFKIADPTLFKRILEGNLAEIETMETMRSVSVIDEVTGKESETKTKDSFSKLLREKKLGYMAAVKNIRNALVEGLEDSDLDLWCAYISNPIAIKNSRMLPFRYWDMWNELGKIGTIDRFKMNKIKDAVDKAFMISASGIQFAEPTERVAVILDDSGSMASGWSFDATKGNSPYINGLLLSGIIMANIDKGNLAFYTFNTTTVDKTDAISKSVLNFASTTRAEGGGTDVGAPLAKLLQSKTKVDKIVLFTDMQLYDADSTQYDYSCREFGRYLDEYKQKINPNVKVLFWNLEGYAGGTPLKMGKDVMEVSGFSDKLLKLIPEYWNDSDALVHAIEAVEL